MEKLFKTMKTSEATITLLRNLKDHTTEPMYKIQERLLIAEHKANNIELPKGIEYESVQ